MVCRGIPNFLIFDNIDCGYSLEPPLARRFSDHVPTIYVLRNNRIYLLHSTDNLQFYTFTNFCILHGQVFIMPANSLFVFYLYTFIFSRYRRKSVHRQSLGCIS